jgi:hypothetical protein
MQVYLQLIINNVLIQGLSNPVYLAVPPQKCLSAYPNPLSQNAWYPICSKAQRPLKFFKGTVASDIMFGTFRILDEYFFAAFSVLGEFQAALWW